MNYTEMTQTNWSQLLQEAVRKPGMMLEAYSRFHGYSIGNRILALFQCAERGIAPGPIATYPKWQTLGRQVRKGQKALTLCMPVTVKKRKDEKTDADADETFTRFVYRPNWFTLSQTDGPDVEFSPAPEWNREKALQTLGVSVVPFEYMDGNAQGVAMTGRRIAINPVAQLPLKTLFHELGHVLLGHCDAGKQSDGEQLSRNLTEAEAESVALICCESLGLPGADYCRGYVQSWLHGAEIPEKSAQRVFKVANQILEAGI